MYREKEKIRYYLTAEQYKIMAVTAYNLCVTVHDEEKYYSYTYVNCLADFVSVLTGIYPEQEVLLEAWHKAEEMDGSGTEQDINTIIKIFIGKFNYEKYGLTNDGVAENNNRFSKEQIDTLKKIKGASDPIIYQELSKGIKENLIYIGPSDL